MDTFDKFSNEYPLLFCLLMGIVTIAGLFFGFLGPIIMAFCMRSLWPLLLYILTFGVCLGLSVYGEIS